MKELPEELKIAFTAILVLIGITCGTGAFVVWLGRDGYMKFKVTRKLPVARQIEVTDGKNTYYFSDEGQKVSGTYCFKVTMINPGNYGRLVDDYFCDKNNAN